MAKVKKKPTRRVKKTQKSPKLKIFGLLAVFLCVVGLIIFGYNFSNQKPTPQPQQITKKTIKQPKKEPIKQKITPVIKLKEVKIEEFVEQKTDKNIKTKDENIKTKNIKNENIHKNTDESVYTQNPFKSDIKKDKPKLAIIIDDVSFYHEVKSIKKIPYKVTPSFLPPTKRHKDSAKIAKYFNHYLVHLPLQAYNNHATETKTLQVNESYENINSWLKQLKKLYPKAKYYNNHTGSAFTASLQSMNNLYKAFNENSLFFIDSFTTANSKANIAAKNNNSIYIKRDIFLDHQKSKAHVKKQLKKAIKIAKIKGYAIAIGHPHKNTLSVLQNAKDMLQEVNLVYLDELFE